MGRWYRLDGRTPVLDPTEGLQPAEQRRVARTEITPDVYVSTVFLGLDHGYTVDGPPVLFETMVFSGQFDQEQERYATWAEARGRASALGSAGAGRRRGLLSGFDEAPQNETLPDVSTRPAAGGVQHPP